MKKTKLKKQSKDLRKIALRKADKSLQDSYKKHYPNEKCEVCGQPFNLMHHHILKSNSNYTRFLQPTNLVFLCKKCHDSLHLGGNINIVSIYTLKRGKKWEEEIIKLKKHPKISLYVKRLEEIKNYYDNNVPEKYEVKS